MKDESKAQCPELKFGSLLLIGSPWIGVDNEGNKLIELQPSNFDRFRMAQLLALTKMVALLKTLNTPEAQAILEEIGEL